MSRKEKVLQAIELVKEARELVKEALVNSEETQAHYSSYEEYGFLQLLGQGNKYDYSLKDLLKEIK